MTVHFESEGVPISMLLDIVEVAESHSGVNLAVVFARVLKEFGIEDKVSYVDFRKAIADKTHIVVPDAQHYLRQRVQQRQDDRASIDAHRKLPGCGQPDKMLCPHPQPGCQKYPSSI